MVLPANNKGPVMPAPLTSDAKPAAPAQGPATPGKVPPPSEPGREGSGNTPPAALGASDSYGAKGRPIASLPDGTVPLSALTAEDAALARKFDYLRDETIDMADLATMSADARQAMDGPAPVVPTAQIRLVTELLAKLQELEPQRYALDVAKQVDAAGLIKGQEADGHVSKAELAAFEKLLEQEIESARRSQNHEYIAQCREIQAVVARLLKLL